MIPYELKEDFISNQVRFYNEVSYTNHNICAKFGGKCCKFSACELMPCDIIDFSVSGIRKMLETGKYSISFRHLFGTELLPILQIREVGQGKIFNTLMHNKCALLMDEEPYCPFGDAERPSIAQLLIPKADGKCRGLLENDLFISEWMSAMSIMN
jgi:hypothetical protein